MSDRLRFRRSVSAFCVCGSPALRSLFILQYRIASTWALDHPCPPPLARWDEPMFLVPRVPLYVHPKKGLFVRLRALSSLLTKSPA